MQIPVQNIYFLLVYAWDKLEESSIIKISSETFEDYKELFARVLINGCGILLRRGLDRDYIVQTEQIRGIKGKFLASETVKSNSLTHAQTVCSFDNFSYDVLDNRILKYTLFNLLNVSGMPEIYRKELKSLYLKFQGVSLTHIRIQDFKKVRLNRNNSFYGFLLNVCYLIYSSFLPSEKSGETFFKDFTRDEARMANLFEAFVRNFYKKNLKNYSVRSENIEWFLQPVHEEHRALIPIMKTDISLESPVKKIVIDCKYYSETLVKHYDKETINPNHLYQIVAYLSNIHFMDPRPLEGILLYPVVTSTVNIPMRYGEYDLRVCSINLNQDWKEIEKDLISLIN